MPLFSIHSHGECTHFGDMFTLNTLCMILFLRLVFGQGPLGHTYNVMHGFLVSEDFYVVEYLQFVFANYNFKKQHVLA